MINETLSMTRREKNQLLKAANMLAEGQASYIFEALLTIGADVALGQKITYLYDDYYILSSDDKNSVKILMLLSAIEACPTV